MKRGEIYFIARRDTVGAEIEKARPAVVVSEPNENSPIVSVVYLNTQPKRDLPTHVTINATGRPSTVLCEQIDTVSVALIGNACGTCTAEELAAIDKALAAALGLDVKETKPQGDLDLAEVGAELIRVTMERDFYKDLFEKLLRKQGVSI